MKTKRGELKEHDSFIKEFFSEPRWAQELFRLRMPRELYQILDFSRMTVSIGGAAFEDNTELRSDILFSLPPMGEDRLIYLYFEHSSGDKGELALEIHRKADAIKKQKAREEIKGTGKKRQPGVYVICTLLYQSEEPWPYRQRAREDYDLPSYIHDILERYASPGNILVLDLGLIEPEDLDTCLTMKAVLYTLKYIRSPKFEEKLPQIAAWLEEDGDLSVIKRLGKYITNYLDESVETFDLLIEKLQNTKLGVETMGVGQLIREEAYLKGLEKGLEEKEEEKFQIASNLLRQDVSLEIVLKATGLTENQLREVGVLKD